MTVLETLKEEIVQLKWRVLLVVCFLPFGSYYIYDFPGAIGTGPLNTIQSYYAQNGKEYNQEMNQALYSVYSYPNTILAVLGGVLIDRVLGLRRAMLLFTLLVFFGAILFYVGTVTTTYWVLVVARFIFGLGGESLAVSQSAFVARWFRGGRGMALAFGITISFSRVGSSFNFLFSPMFALNKGITFAVAAGIGACAISVISCVVLIFVDIYAEKIGYIQPEAYQNTADEGQKVLNCASVKELPLTMWLLCGICVFCYCAIFPFIGIGKNFFEVKFNISGDTAASYMSLYMFVSAGLSPIIGIVVDVTGRNSLWLIAACSCFLLIHLLMLVSMIPPYVAMVFMGIFYSFLVSGLWPSVPYVVEEHVSGFSYGLMTSLQNIGLATFPLITGGILQSYTPPSTPASNNVNASEWMILIEEFNTTVAPPSDGVAQLPTLTGFEYTEALFMASAGTALIFALLLLFVDLRRNRILTMSSTERKKSMGEVKNPLINASETTSETP